MYNGRDALKKYIQKVKRNEHRNLGVYEGINGAVWMLLVMYVLAWKCIMAAMLFKNICVHFCEVYIDKPALLTFSCSLDFFLNLFNQIHSKIGRQQLAVLVYTAFASSKLCKFLLLQPTSFT